MQIKIDHTTTPDSIGGETPWMECMQEAEMPRLIQQVMDRGVLGENVTLVMLQIANGDKVYYKV